MSLPFSYQSHKVKSFFYENQVRLIEIKKRITSKTENMKKLIECVPNFSEGVDMQIIKQITDQIESVEGVSLLDVDPALPPTERLLRWLVHLMR